MRSERGQASVEWIGLVLLLALGLTALAIRTQRGRKRARRRARARADLRGARRLRGGARRAGGERRAARRTRAAAPVGSSSRRRSCPCSRGSGRRSRRRLRADPPAAAAPPRLAEPLLRRPGRCRRAGRGAGTLWRRAWLPASATSAFAGACSIRRAASRTRRSRLRGPPDRERLPQPGRPRARLGPAQGRAMRRAARAAARPASSSSACCCSCRSPSPPLAAFAPAGRRPLGRRLSRAPRRLRGHARLRRRGARARRAYGEDDAATVRALAPNLVYEPGERQLPVDWRDCRRPECATAPDDPALDAHTSDARAPRHRLHPPDPARRPALRPVLALLPRLEHRPGRARTGSGSAPGSSRGCASSCPARPTIPAFTATTGRGSFVRVDPTAPPGCAPARTATSRAASGAAARTSGSARPAGCASRAAATPATCPSGPSRDRATTAHPPNPALHPAARLPVAAAAARAARPGPRPRRAHAQRRGPAPDPARDPRPWTATARSTRT